MIERPALLPKPIYTRMAGLMACLLVSGTAGSEVIEPERFVSAWSIETAERAPMYRLSLSQAVIETLQHDQARDLAIVDRQGRAVTLYRLAPEALIETRRSQHAVPVNSRWLSADTPEPQTPLHIRVQQGDQSVLIQGPGVQRTDQRGPLRFESLLALPEDDYQAPQVEHSLQLDWQVSSPLQAACWLSIPTGEPPASLAVSPRLLQDGFPRRYRAIVHLPAGQFQVTQLHCFGEIERAEDDQFSATLHRTDRIDHNREITLRPARLGQQSPHLEFVSPGPFSLRRLELDFGENSWIGTVTIQTANSAEGPWQRPTQQRLDALQQPRHSLSVDTNRDRPRYWRLTFDPPLIDTLDLTLFAAQDSLVFLHQGEPDWALLAGSLSQTGLQPREVASIEALGGDQPLWLLPTARLGQQRDSGGREALQPPAEPVDLTQWLLWLILFGGGALIILLAWQLLRRGSSGQS